MSKNITFKRLTIYNKNPESSWTEMTNYIQGNNNSSDCRFLNQSLQWSEDSGTTVLRTEEKKKKNFNPKFYTQRKYPSKNEEQRSIDREVSSLDREKLRQFATSIPALQELLRKFF